MLQQQYELDRKDKIERIDREVKSGVALYDSQKSRNGFSAFISTNTLAKPNLTNPLAKPNLERALIPLTFQASKGTLSKLIQTGILQDIIMLSGDSKEINKDPLKGKVPKEDINEDLLRWYRYNDVDEYLEDTFFYSLEKETKDKSSMDTFPGSTDEETSDTESTDKNITVRTTCKNILSYKHTIEKYVPVVKSASKKTIFKSPQTIRGVMLGLAILKTWDDIVQKIGKRPPESYADKGKGKAKV
uniref:Uncharacterized protein n=1 Tax=Tanacetum cinerariifolium TaxID=118510 RepID=A0A699ICW1_TANCI|nr:hypothetical protein [Tanacetum cinerariifolium]